MIKVFLPSRYIATVQRCRHHGLEPVLMHLSLKIYRQVVDEPMQVNK